MGYLIDTCLWIDVERGRLSPADIARTTKRQEIFISPVTISELQFGVEMAVDPAVRISRQRAVDILKKKPLLRMDEETGAIHGRISAELRKSGKQDHYRIMDLWLAAQAIQHNMSFLTKNTKDFTDIPGLLLVGI
jgi:predicted nucleic acid-binding protein